LPNGSNTRQRLGSTPKKREGASRKFYIYRNNWNKRVIPLPNQLKACHLRVHSVRNRSIPSENRSFRSKENSLLSSTSWRTNYFTYNLYRQRQECRKLWCDSWSSSTASNDNAMKHRYSNTSQKRDRISEMLKKCRNTTNSDCLRCITKWKRRGPRHLLHLLTIIIVIKVEQFGMKLPNMPS